MTQYAPSTVWALYTKHPAISQVTTYYVGHNKEHPMANNVTAVQLGAQPKVLNNVHTVQDILTQFDLSGVSIKVGGESQDADYKLSDYDFVSFGEKVKGGTLLPHWSEV